MNSLGKTYGNGHKVADKESSSASKTLLDGDTIRASERVDYEVCSLGRRNINHRCGYFTILSPDANGDWKAVAVPLQCLIFSKHAGSESESFTDETFSEPKVHHQCQSKALTSKVSSGNAFPGKSASHSSLNYDGFDVTNLSNIHVGTSKLGKPRARNKRKKAKKKGKRDRKISLDAGSVDVVCVHESSMDGNSSSKKTKSTGSISCESSSTVLSPDSSSNTSEDINGGIDEVDLLEINSSDSFYESFSCMKDSGPSVLPEANDSLVIDSVAVYSNADDADVSSSSSVDKKYKLSKEVPLNSSIFFQEVCGNDSDECCSGMEKVESFNSESVNSLKIDSFVEKDHIVSQFKILSTSKDKNQSKVNKPGKFQPRTSVGSNKAFNCDSSKLSYASKSTSNLCMDFSKELYDAVDISRHLGQEKGFIDISKSFSEVDCKRTESEAEIIVPGTSEHFHQLEGFSNKVEPLEELCFTSSYSLHDLTIEQECNSKSSHCVDKEVLENSMLGNNAIEKPLSEAFDYSVNSSTKCFTQGSRTDNAKHSDTEVPNGKDSVETVVNNVSNTIKQTINDAHREQLASEAVEMVIGCPIAEVERFLRAASPVINLPNNISHCWTCSNYEVPGAPLCGHEMPNLSLGNLWQWYEKHGTFGLEVKADDCENSKRLGVDRFSFLAYFVPFLSAVQLFSPRQRLPENFSRETGLQIFSVLVPWPSIMGNATEQLDDSTSADEAELVYEYFESERPQQRRPLFEMIKHLSSGNEPLQAGAFGDPSKLVSEAINDLHPKSWYSVAWYPIYRIPDEKFHSAFLTYHSLGHLTRGTASIDSFSGNARVVSPVVGLQSYNTQGECWLKPRNVTQSQIKEIPNLNHCEILKERLKTLENTASVMARAEVVKGNATSVNRQPDYEFFLSRRRE